jgi:hypothetical protein
MFEMALYFLGAYLIILAPAFAFFRERLHKRKPNISRKQRLTLLAAYWLCPLLPYAVVEAQTIIFQPWLRPAIAAALRDDGEHERYKNCKVLLVMPWAASVYVVTEVSPGLPEKPYNAGLQMDLVLTLRGWRQQGAMGCIWSDEGNADGNVFPPYPTDEGYRTAKL